MQASIIYLVIFLAVLIVLTRPLGTYILPIAQGRAPNFLKNFDVLVMKIFGVRANAGQGWFEYALCLVLFQIVGMFFLYLLLRLQAYLPFNPENTPSVESFLAFNIAISFVTNTNWQAYIGEEHLSYFTQMIGLGVQNFLSSATGLCVALVLMRALAWQEVKQLGNFFADFIRINLYILLPIAFIYAIYLVSQGVIQNLSPYLKIDTLANFKQTIAMGPVASQEAIKLLGSNGGGFFAASSAHPFANPNSWTNFISSLVMLLISASLTYTFGLMVKDTRQGWSIFSVMALFFILAVISLSYFESRSSPQLRASTTNALFNLDNINNKQNNNIAKGKHNYQNYVGLHNLFLYKRYKDPYNIITLPSIYYYADNTKIRYGKLGQIKNIAKDNKVRGKDYTNNHTLNINNNDITSAMAHADYGAPLIANSELNVAHKNLQQASNIKDKIATYALPDISLVKNNQVQLTTWTNGSNWFISPIYNGLNYSLLHNKNYTQGRILPLVSDIQSLDDEYGIRNIHYGRDKDGNSLSMRLDSIIVTRALLHLGAFSMNFEGKEVRFDLGQNALFTVASAASSSASHNSSLDSMTPLGGMVPMLLIQSGGVIFGGVGSGFYSMISFCLLAAFLGGLMVGRTPEYLGKKIGVVHLRLVSLSLLFPALLVLVSIGISLNFSEVVDSLGNPSAHGFSTLVYNFSSVANNSGSSFDALFENNSFFNVLFASIMFLSRFVTIIATLALSGILVKQRSIQSSLGTMKTYGISFNLLLVGVIFLMGMFTYMPALVLGPIAEYFMLWG